VPNCSYLDQERELLYIGGNKCMEIFDCIEMNIIKRIITQEGMMNKIAKFLFEDKLMLGQTNGLIEIYDMEDHSI
jgi:hypothetical protein